MLYLYHERSFIRMINNEETVGQMIARAREEKGLSKREL